MQLFEILIGFGIAGTGFGVILAIVGRAASPERRSLTLGIATAAGSAGQVVGPPFAETLLGVMPWSSVFLVFAALILAHAPAPAADLRPRRARPLHEPEESMGAIVGRAVRDPSFTLIFLGFFSCGYQLGFITAHFPAFVTEVCSPIPAGGVLAALGITTTSALGALAIAVIGLANIGGTLAAGALGQHYRKKYLLAQIYLARTIVAAAFILAPMTPATVLLFSALMGALWLATVPLTSGLVAEIWGIRYMGTLYGIVFFSHQLGAFLGVWLGGRLYDITGTYTAGLVGRRRRRRLLRPRPPADPRAPRRPACLTVPSLTARAHRRHPLPPQADSFWQGAYRAVRGPAKTGRKKHAANRPLDGLAFLPFRSSAHARLSERRPSGGPRAPEAGASPPATSSPRCTWSRRTRGCRGAPPSRPSPLCLTPPNGAAGSETSPRFSPTMPASSRSDTRRPRARSPV